MPPMAELRFGKALNLALEHAMREDPRVIMIGEDIAAAGGPFGVTRGLLKEFGADRVIDSPIAESGLVGAAVGAALTGLRPVAEIMFMDFVTLAMDQIVNQAAKANYMFGGQATVPMVARMPHGGGISAGPQHSQCLEAWFAHIPGLKVVVPSNAADAYGLLRAAIADDHPVMFIENKTLYARSDVFPDVPPVVEIGQAAIAREGSDVTLVTYGAMVDVSMKAAKALEGGGVSVEIVDLRTIQPWDENTVLTSLSKTHRLVVVHEAVEAFGVGAEIAARMADIGFDELDAPIVRVGAPFTPVPFALPLEAAYRPDAAKVAAAVRRVLE